FTPSAHRSVSSTLERHVHAEAVAGVVDVAGAIHLATATTTTARPARSRHAVGACAIGHRGQPRIGPDRLQTHLREELVGSRSALDLVEVGAVARQVGGLGLAL